MRNDNKSWKQGVQRVGKQLGGALAGRLGAVARPIAGRLGAVARPVRGLYQKGKKVASNVYKKGGKA